jgi:hypothetical protein
VGAIASQLSKKKPQKEARAPSKADSIDASDNTKPEGQVVSKKKKRHRGSFSFLGGMQVGARVLFKQALLEIFCV